MAELSPEDIARRLRAKRVNERIKLAASTVNAVGLAVVGVTVLVPIMAGTAGILSVAWIAAAFVLHLMAQVVLGNLQSED